jgi:hypothetical protein
MVLVFEHKRCLFLQQWAAMHSRAVSSRAVSSRAFALSRSICEQHLRLKNLLQQPVHKMHRERRGVGLGNRDEDIQRKV